jgi:hypothetical protein
MRLQQHERSIARQLGASNVDELKQRLETLKQLETQEEQRKQAAMSELERERDRAQKAELRAQDLERQHAEAQASARITQACATAGVRNVDYARFLIDTARRAGDQRPESDLLGAYLGEDQHRAALGVVQAPSATPTPVSTTAPPGAPAPSNGSQTPGGNASVMSKDEWSAHKRSLGLV